MYASHFRLVVAAGSILLCSQTNALTDDKKTPAKEDPKLAEAWKTLEGRWKRVGITERNTFVEEREGDGYMVITRDGVAAYRNGKQTSDGSDVRFAIDPTQEPAHLDWVYNPKSPMPYIMKGIYRIEGDTMDIVIHRFENTVRPTTFVNNIFDKNKPLKTHYKRVKEEQK